MCDNETDAGRDVFFRENIWNPLTTEQEEANRDSVPDAGKPTRTLLQHFSLELKEHVKGMCHSTNGLDGLDVGFFLHKNRVLRSDSDVVGVQVHSLKKHAPWDSCTTPPLFSPTRSPCTSSRCWRCLQRLHHMWKAWCKRGKKVWVHGLMQRVHPRLVGSSRENMNMTENMNTRTHLDSDNKWIHIWPPKRPHPHKCL